MGDRRAGWEGKTLKKCRATGERRNQIGNWVAINVLPLEPAVRAWLSRVRVSQEDAEDLIQEAYCLLAGLDSVDHILRPDAYFFSTVRNLLRRRLRRATVVPITAVAELEEFRDDRPSPEREVGGRRDYDRVRAIIATLPEPCRRVVELRRIEGVPQRQIAQALGISEGMVEWHVHRGIQAVLKHFGNPQHDLDSEPQMGAAGTQRIQR